MDNRERDHDATKQTDIGMGGFAGGVVRVDGTGGKYDRYASCPVCGPGRKSV
jgi:hypothetical protein